jgi:hypothetical protein
MNPPKLPQLPREKIVETDIFATSFNSDRLNIEQLERIVVLACRHHLLTKNTTSAHCPRCQRMFDLGLDWDRYRNMGDAHVDDMAWHEDPCRRFNEPHDLICCFAASRSSLIGPTSVCFPKYLRQIHATD